MSSQPLQQEASFHLIRSVVVGLRKNAMIKNLTQESGIGKALCIVGIIAIVVGAIEFFSGVGAMADASGYFEEVSKLSANIQLIGAAGSAIGGLFMLGFSEVVRCLNEISSASFKHGNVQNDLPNLPKL